MTNHWIDVKNARTIMVLGANPVENHPVVAQYINEARAATPNAKVIVADPRRTRTAAQADIFMRMRPGTNGALIMGLINYLITNNLYDASYQTRTVGRTFTDASGNTVSKTVPKYTDATFQLKTDRMDYERDGNGFPVITTLGDSNSVFSVLAARAAHYTTSVVEGICDITPGQFEVFAAAVAASRGDTSVGFEDGTGPLKGAQFPGTILYAMGGTQSTHASQDLRAYSMLQMLLGNMGKAGGGVNALRGIHNVQGSTDMGVLFSSMPGYSDVPPTTGSGSLYGDYMDKLFGGPRVAGTGGFYWNKNDAANGWNLQQHGFRNTIWHWFGQGPDPLSADVLTDAPTTITNPNFDLLPKGNGLNHIQMFQKAASGYVGADKVKCMFVLGQNPAVTEPNLTMVKAGLYGLDTLVVTDMFESETAGCSRKSDGVTYLLPSSSFVEEEGSVTNSGRWIQWRYKAINPQGKSKSDTEILLTLASKLFTANAFTHITGETYASLYGYGWTPGVNADASDFNNGTTAATVAENIFTVIAHKNQNASPYGALWIYRGGVNGWNQVFGSAGTIAAASAGATTLTASTLTGVYNGSVLWVGSGATMEQVCVASHTGNVTLNLTKGLKFTHSASEPIAHVLNRAKARGTVDVGDQASDTLSGKSIYGNWGWAWLKNRRVFYNNGAVNQDVADAFVAPDQVGRYFVHGDTDTGKPTPVAYATTYRAYSTLKDLNNGNGFSGAVAGDKARMPKHWEPHETPREDLRTKYGTTGDASTAVGGGGSNGAVANFPLVLTTIRVTEHFQGGPTTRNIPWLCELQPDVFIEINSADAYRYGIAEGDDVYIDTARASNAGPFKARVGVGTGATQLVKKGTVAIPWHWGNKGISTGESANTVTIDSLDTNIKMPEYKACLCRIHHGLT